MEWHVLEGVYEDGKIDWKEHPAGVKQARVRVTLLPESEVTRRRSA